MRTLGARTVLVREAKTGGGTPPLKLNDQPISAA